MDRPRIVGSVAGQMTNPRRKVFAWAQITTSSSSLTLVDSEGVGALTWNSTGNYSIDWNNPRPDSNYSVTLSSKFGGAAGTQPWNIIQSITSSGFRTFFERHSDSQPFDPPLITFVAIGSNLGDVATF